MKSKYRYFIFIAVFAAALLFASNFVYADGTLYVNYADAALPRISDGVYAVGSGGVERLPSGKLYALTGDGLEALDGSASESGNRPLPGNGTIEIPGRTVKIGLFYSYSEYRDSSLDSSLLENTSGGGFIFGSYDENDVFTELASTDFSRIMVRPGENNAVYISSADQDEPICGLEYTDKTRYLIVRPEPAEDEPLTSFAGNEYYGEFGFAVLARSRLTVINIVDTERYVMGVCACEMIEGWPLEALKAQAVAARTFVQKNARKSVYYYSCGFDVTADTYCQAYRGNRGVGETIIAAVRATENQYLTCNGQLIDAAYSAADGGATEDGENVFGYASDYLVGVFDPYEAAANNENPYSRWSVTMTPTQLGEKVGLDRIVSVTPTKSRTGNVIKLEFVSASGRTATVIRDNCRTTLGLFNIHYEISRDSSGNFVFTGSGCGHNLGMSQWGAYAMAVYYNMDYRSILNFYYSNTSLEYGYIADEEI